MPVGFWDMFFDSDYRQRQDIEDLRDQIAAASTTSGLSVATGTLFRQVQDLTALVTVLVKMLEESGHLDAKVLRYRVEAELEAMQAARSAQHVPSMNEALQAGSATVAPAEPPPPTTPTACAKCGQVVPANRTTITASGVLCDRCAG